MRESTPSWHGYGLLFMGMILAVYLHLSYGTIILVMVRVAAFEGGLWIAFRIGRTRAWRTIVEGFRLRNRAFDPDPLAQPVKLDSVSWDCSHCGHHNSLPARSPWWACARCSRPWAGWYPYGS